MIVVLLLSLLFLYVGCNKKDSKAELIYKLNSTKTLYEVVGVTNNDLKEMVIPVIYKKLLVVGIGYEAFSGCGSLKSIVIPESVTSIGYWAFSSCLNLTIYCEAKEELAGWIDGWNPSERPVVWGGV